MSKSSKSAAAETSVREVKTEGSFDAANENNEREEVTWVIQEHLGVLSTNKWGWAREVNLVSWNGNPGKLDIRNWNPEHSKMGRGMTFNGSETAFLCEILKNLDIAAAGI